jgi:hypothetical protein
MLTKGVLLEYISDLWSEVTILEGRIAKLEDSAKPKADKKPKAEKEKRKPGRPKGSTKKK